MPHYGEALDRPTIFLSPTRRNKYDSERTRHPCLANRPSRASPGGPLYPSKGAHCHLKTCMGISKR